MNTVEVVNPSALPFTEQRVHPDDELFDRETVLASRPLETEADWIAAAAAPGCVEARYMADLMPDDAMESAHLTGSCSICNEESSEYVLHQKRADEEEMAYFNVAWDPTITF